LEVLAAHAGLIISEVLGAFFPVHRKPKANLITEPVEVNINGAAFLLNSICGYAVGYCIVSDDICSGLRNAKQIIY
jgi:hypothetical protein